MTSIRTLSRRVALLQEQEKSLLSFWDRVGDEIERGERDRAAPDYLHNALIEHSDAEAEYLISYVNTLIDLLQTMIEDEDHIGRLETARKQFFLVMAQIEELDSKPRAVHWHNILSHRPCPTTCCPQTFCQRAAGVSRLTSSLRVGMR